MHLNKFLPTFASPKVYLRFRALIFELSENVPIRLVSANQITHCVNREVPKLTHLREGDNCRKCSFRCFILLFPECPMSYGDKAFKESGSRRVPQ